MAGMFVKGFERDFDLYTACDVAKAAGVKEILDAAGHVVYVLGDDGLWRTPAADERYRELISDRTKR